MCIFLYTSRLLLVLSFPYFGNNLWFWETCSSGIFLPCHILGNNVGAVCDGSCYVIQRGDWFLLQYGRVLKTLSAQHQLLTALAQEGSKPRFSAAVSCFQCSLHLPSPTHKYLTWLLINKYLLTH